MRSFEKFEFLEQEEKRLAGEVVKVPINVDLWREKIHFANYCLMNTLVYLCLTFSNRGDDKSFLERISHLKQYVPIDEAESEDDPMKTCLSLSTKSEKMLEELFVDKYGLEELHNISVNNDLQTFDEVFRSFLDIEYEPPIYTVEIFNHLFHYVEYQLYTYSVSKYFYPTVNEFINFAGINLIQESDSIILGIASREREKDRVRPGSQKKKALAEARKERLGNLLRKYPDVHSNRKQKQSFIIEAMKMEDVSSSRTIENYLKKLKPKQE